MAVLELLVIPFYFFAVLAMFFLMSTSQANWRDKFVSKNIKKLATILLCILCICLVLISRLIFSDNVKVEEFTNTSPLTKIVSIYAQVAGFFLGFVNLMLLFYNLTLTREQISESKEEKVLSDYLKLLDSNINGLNDVKNDIFITLSNGKKIFSLEACRILDNIFMLKKVEKLKETNAFQLVDNQNISFEQLEFDDIYYEIFRHTFSLFFLNLVAHLKIVREIRQKFSSVDKRYKYIDDTDVERFIDLSFYRYMGLLNTSQRFMIQKFLENSGDDEENFLSIDFQPIINTIKDKLNK